MKPSFLLRFTQQPHPIRQRTAIAVRTCILVLGSTLALGCSRLPKSAANNYLTVPDQSSVVNAKAQKLNARGKLALEANDLATAEELFGQALKADVNYGSAHNNLGQVYLARKQLYLAAWEFEFAKNLMPDRPEVELNLGLVYETANRLRQAESHYLSVLERDPRNPQALASLARVNVKLDEDPTRINELLNEVLMSNLGPEWVCWARDLLATKYALDAGNDMHFPSSGMPANDINRLSLPLTLPQSVQEEQLPFPAPRSETVVPPPRNADELEKPKGDDTSNVLTALPTELSSTFLNGHTPSARTLENLSNANWSSFPEVPEVYSASYSESLPRPSSPTKSIGQ